MSKQKNTTNKKLHSKLLAQKKNKEKTVKELHKMRLRELAQLVNKQKQEQQEGALAPEKSVD